MPLSSSSVRSLTDLFGLGGITGGRTTGGHMPGFSAARLAAVSLIAMGEGMGSRKEGDIIDSTISSVYNVVMMYMYIKTVKTESSIESNVKLP